MRQVRATRCTLEPQTAAHAHEMFAVLCDEAIYEFENEPPRSEAWLAERYPQAGKPPVIGRHTNLAELGGSACEWRACRLCAGHSLLQSGTALIAYELASRFWRKGIGSSAVAAMLDELRSGYGVHQFVAELKSANYRSWVAASSRVPAGVAAANGAFRPGARRSGHGQTSRSPRENHA